MDWATIGAWAGDKGPFLFIIAFQAKIIVSLLERHFAQQDVLIDSLRNSRRAIEHVETKDDPGV